MNLRTATLVLLSIFLASSAPAQAAGFIGTGAALDARDALISEFSEGRSRDITFNAMDQIVKLSVEALAKEGRPDLATRFRKAWKQESAEAFSHFIDIGDHAPLSRVLSDLAVVMKKVLGKNSKYYDLIADLDTMNYAIPVVLAPAGGWQKGRTKNDRMEYRKHFVPFSGIVTYYASLGACLGIANRYGMGPLGKRLCPPIAGRLEVEMTDRIAPKLAVYIFNKANDIGTLLELQQQDFIYLTEESLENGLRWEN